MNIDQKRARLAELRTLLLALAERGTDLEGQDAEDWEAHNAEFDTLRDEVAAWEAREARVEEIRKLAVNPANVESGSPQIVRQVDASTTPEEVRYLRPAEARDRALKILEDEDSTRHLSAAQIDQVEKVLRTNTADLRGDEVARRLLLTENDAYRSGWAKCVTQVQPFLTEDERRAMEEFRNNSLTTTAGGFGVPILIDPTIILTGQETDNPFFQLSRVENITTTTWKGVSSAGVTWSFDAEAAEVSDDSPTVAQPSVTAHMARGFIGYSIEIGDDYPGYAGEMARLLAEGYSELLVETLTTGSGSGAPFGIVTALDANTNVEVTPTTDGAFASVDIYKVWKALPQKYRRRASWMMNVDVNNEIRGFGDDKLHQQTVNLEAGALDTLMGRPVYENPYMAEFTSTTGASNILIVGDFSNFLIAQRVGMSVELVPHLFGLTANRPTGERGWFAHARVGADSINDLGFRLLQNQ
jgi:HK97 family phage major capsid protein